MSEEFETLEIEVSDEDILYYLVDENDVEVGFVLEEDGVEVEYYYEEYKGINFALADEKSGTKPLCGEQNNNAQVSNTTESTKLHTGALQSIDTATQDRHSQDESGKPGYFEKVASIASFEGNKVRKAAEDKLDIVRDKAESNAAKAKVAAKDTAEKAKDAAGEAGLDISREGMSEMTSELNEVAREGAAAAKELKEAYDDIMDNFGFLFPKKRRR